MNLEDVANCSLNKVVKETINTELVSIYTNTFQHVGQKFLDSLMQQVTVQTKAQSSVLLQLLSLEEYKELSRIHNSQNKKFKIMSTENEFHTSSSPDLDEPSPQHPTQLDSIYDILHDQFLLIRSCYTHDPNIESM